MLKALANLFKSRTPLPHDERQFIYTVILHEAIPGRTQRRGKKHFLVVHARNEVAAEAEAKRLASRHGITLRDSDIHDIQGSGRFA